MRARTIILVACGALGLTMGASPAWAVQLTLQGSQEAGSILSGPKIVAPPVIDGQQAASATNVTPGTIDVGQSLGTSGIEGPEGAWIYIGDDQDTGYDRGVACWKGLVISAEATQPDAPILDHHVPD